MKVLVTGKNGQLGKALYDETTYPHCPNSITYSPIDYIKENGLEFVFADRDEFNLCWNEKRMGDYLKDNEIKIIINTAAYTNVEDAEDVDRQMCYDVNCNGVDRLSRVAEANGCYLIHVSTDYVFGGDETRCVPYFPSSETSPINEYGKSKLIGELAIKTNMKSRNYTIVRTSWLYSKYGKNIVKSIADKLSHDEEVKAVWDQVSVPTSAELVSKFILGIFSSVKGKVSENGFYYKNYLFYDESEQEKFKGMIVNAVPSGLVSVHGLALDICVMLGKDEGLVTEVYSKALGQKARRPRYSVLATPYYSNFDDYKVYLGRFISKNYKKS